MLAAACQRLRIIGEFGYEGFMDCDRATSSSVCRREEGGDPLRRGAPGRCHEARDVAASVSLIAIGSSHARTAR